MANLKTPDNGMLTKAGAAVMLAGMIRSVEILKTEQEQLNRAIELLNAEVSYLQGITGNLAPAKKKLLGRPPIHLAQPIVVPQKKQRRGSYSVNHPMHPDNPQHAAFMRRVASARRKARKAA